MHISWLILVTTLSAEYVLANRQRTLNCDCGQSNHMLRWRIVGGVDSQPHEYPWQVLITSAAGSVFCGGSIITDRHILTAGHCVYYTDPYKLLFHVGLHDRQTPGPGSQILNVKQVFLHPEFVSMEVYDIADAAIVRTVQRIRFNALVRPICLPQSPLANYAGRKATVAGWGQTRFGSGQNSAVLKATRVRVLSATECNATQMGPYVVADRMMCAYARDRDSCQGDSGGPLTVATRFNRWEQVGVVSFGAGCGSPNVPAVYVPVAFLLPWLRQVTREGSVCRDPEDAW